MIPDAADEALFRSALEAGIATLGLSLSAAEIEACSRYKDLLLATNEHTNLTRITAPADVAVKHFVDSLTVLSAVPNLAPKATLLDVGTGAGFPGLVLKIVRPELRVTLMDSLAKRLTFLGEVIEALGLEQVTLVHARAEDAGRDPAHRDRYDLVTARAVAALPTLLEWCTPFVRPSSGRFVAMKAANVDVELAAAESASFLLHARLEADLPLELPTVPGDTEVSSRRLLVYRKSRPTPALYPRRPAEIKAKPLGG